MSDSPPYPDTGDTGVGSDRASHHGMPRWVKISAIVVVVLVLLVVGLMLIGGGGHEGKPGPGQHGSMGLRVA
jgi:hypothetical protein